MENTVQKQTEEELLKQLSIQLEEVVKTLLKLRKPDTAYEIVRAVDSTRQVLHWVADGYGAIKFANSK